MLSLAIREKSQPEQWRAALVQFACEMRVAIPCIVDSFNATKQTITALPAVSERMLSLAGIPVDVDLQPLEDVQISLPRGGNFALTMPIAKGDECLVVFCDACIDDWFQSGQRSDQIDLRRHDLSDGIAIFGPWSQPRVLSAYSITSAQLRSQDGTVVIDIAGSALTLTAPTVTVNAQNANVTASQKAVVMGSEVDVTGTTKVVITGNGSTVIEGGAYLAHSHSGVTAGSGVSGPVVAGT